MFKIHFWNQEKNFDKLIDEELVQKTKDWDNLAFEILYDRYKNKIYSYIWNILNYNEHESTLVLSDVFIKVFEYIKKNDVQNFKTFLFKIAHNTCIDFIRTNKSQYKIDDSADQLQDNHDTQEKEKINNKFKEKLIMDYLDQMWEKYKDVLYLYYQEEKSYDKIAQIIWSNKNSVWTIMFNAKKILKEKIKDKALLEALSF